MGIFDKLIEANLQGQRSDIRSVLEASPMFDAEAKAIDGRKIKFGDKWFADFASCNYLGFDLDNEIIESIEPALKKWGVHPSWCRLVASPSLYVQAEELLANLIGAEETLILPTVTLIHIGVIPAMMGNDGIMFLDKQAHMTMYEAAKMARDSGAKLKSFNHGDMNQLETLLRENKDNRKKMILVDGAYSMTGNYADIPTLSKLAAQYDAIVYVDDAHGWGVVGERPDANLPYGYKGNGVVRHFDWNYDNVLYLGGLSKAYSSLAAFISCSPNLKSFFKAYATPYDLSGPCPTASLQSLIAALAVNESRGDSLRKKLYRLTDRAIKGLRGLGFYIDNDTNFPIVSVWIGDTEHLVKASQILWDNGILITLAPYPMVRRGDETLRITITASNEEDEVDNLISAFSQIRDYLNKQKAPLTPLAAKAGG
ncbi:MAG: pyridoxal phosphate-dependent aminotransferase family protein [Candidatus Melainabacteria bacterium]|nr:pyridoxal phosphate-dependent aminotransferase family protein [Candidatus Melainabacteria bacterium]